MKKSKIVLICTISVLSILIIASIVFAGNYLFTRVLVRDNHGSQFEQTWNCSEYGISFKSDNLRFPYQPSNYIGYVKYKDIDTYV